MEHRHPYTARGVLTALGKSALYVLFFLGVQLLTGAIYAAIDIVEHRRAWTEWSRNPLQRAEREKGGRDISVKDLPQTERED